MKNFYSILLIFFFVTLFADENSILTTSGEVKGIKKNKVILWEDIPYAKPPVGDLRWKAPREINIPIAI